jgi:hypothetical protein
MPHVPRSILNAGTLAPLSSSLPMQMPTTEPKPDVPRKDRPKPLKNSMRPRSLSINSYEVDPDRVFEQLFGRPPEVNEHTGVTTNLNIGKPPGLGG